MVFENLVYLLPKIESVKLGPIKMMRRKTTRRRVGVSGRVTGYIVPAINRAESTPGYCREELLGERIEALMPARFKKWQQTECFAEPQLREIGSGLELFNR